MLCVKNGMDTKYNPNDKGAAFNQAAQDTFSPITQDMIDQAEELQQTVIDEAKKQLLD